MRLCNLVSINAKLQRYKTSVLPRLTLCRAVWNFCKAGDSRKLERVRGRGLRAGSSVIKIPLLIRDRLPT